MEKGKEVTSEYKTDDETLKNYQKEFSLLNEEMELFKKFLNDNTQQYFIIPHKGNEAIGKWNNGELGIVSINISILM